MILGFKISPYEALFGCRAKVGLTTSSLPGDVLQDVETGEGHEKIIQSVQTTQEPEETDEGMQETAISAEDMYENAIHDDGNQSSGEAMVIEEPSISMVTEDPSSLLEKEN